MKGIGSIILFLTVLFIGKVASQTPDEKATIYKQRLYETFIVIDTGQGGCLPAARIWPDMNCDNAWHMQTLCKGNGIVPGKNGMAEWMDGTVHWAQYAAWLSTEYFLQWKNGNDVSSLRKEISYAWYALSRLDKASKIKYGRKPQEDGFLLRDDVPTALAAKFPGMHCVKSGEVCRTGIEDGNMMSQDQVIYILWSAAITTKLLPDTITSSLDGMLMKEKIKTKCDQIIHYFRITDWQILDPNGNKVPIGFSAIGYSFAIARIGKIITGKNYQNWSSIVNGRPIWTTIMQIPYDKNNPTQTEVNMGMQLALSSVIGYPSYSRFTQWCEGAGMEIYLLVDALFRNRNVDSYQPMFEKMLNDAPAHGPCYMTANCSNAFGWSGENRWFHPNYRNGSNDQRGAKFNGLDYLLLFNLYQIVYSDKR
jgi:hypothetical protein